MFERPSMAGMAAYALPWLLSCALLFISTCRAQDVCTGVSGTVRVDGDCVLRSMSEPGVLQYVLSGSGAAVVYAFGSSSDSAPASSPLQLAISGVTLANFTLASSASSSPLLWPAEAVGAAPAAGSTLDMTDVRLVVSSEALQTFVKAFSRGPAIYTDNTTYIHVVEGQQGATRLASVTLVTSACWEAGSALTAQPAAASPTRSSGPVCLQHRKGGDLAPALSRVAGVASSAPVLLFLSGVSSLNASAAPAAVSSVTVARPLLFIGSSAQSASLDLGMVVNQLNMTSSHGATLTFVSLALENLAYGDAASTDLAWPYSTLMVHYIWSAVFNRSVESQRLVLHNCTLVVPPVEVDNIMSWVTQLANPLPAAQRQVRIQQLLLDADYKYVARPGSDDDIILLSASSRSQRLVNTLLTSQPVLAPPLPLPASPAGALSPSGPAPLVAVVTSPQELQATVLSENNGRGVALLMPQNLTLGSNANSSWPAAGLLLPQPTCLVGLRPKTGLSMSYKQGLLTVPPGSGEGHVVLKGLVAYRLPQGFEGKAVNSSGNSSNSSNNRTRRLHSTHTQHNAPRSSRSFSAGSTRRSASRKLLHFWIGSMQPPYLPPQAFTLLMWGIKRAMGDAAVVTLHNVTLAVPVPEFETFHDLLPGEPSFVLQLQGDGPGISVREGKAYAGGNEWIKIGVLRGPGVNATNLILIPDFEAEGAMPGYLWAPDQPAAKPSSGMSASALAAAIVIPTMTGLLLAAGLALFLVRRRRAQQGAAAKGEEYAAKDTDWSSQGTPDKGRGSTKASSLERASPTAGTSEAATGSGYPRPGAWPESDRSGSGWSTQMAAGFVAWQAAVRTASAQLLDRRLGGPKSLPSTSPQGSGSKLPVVAAPAVAGQVESASNQQQQQQQPANAPNGAAAATAAAAAAAAQEGSEEEGEYDEEEREDGVGPYLPMMGHRRLRSMNLATLKLQMLLGRGSFGCVYKGTWRGKMVAVKVVHHTSASLMEVNLPERGASLSQPLHRRPARHHSSHMALMEAVIGAHISHPNIVQVYTYALEPLTSRSSMSPASARRNSLASAGGSGSGSQGNALVLPAAGEPEEECGAQGCNGEVEEVAAWCLKLVMEYADAGSLRQALDAHLFTAGGMYPLPSLVLDLAHDVASALLHLHCEGIVHGDVKASNVLLTSAAVSEARRQMVWLAAQAAGGPRARLNAKLADFGLALLLGPADTHATFNLRGTPTHMAPELLLHGHVSKASDVYAFGILLWEMLVGARPYGSIPLPLLPHEVARAGRRPEWPPELLADKDLERCRALAEACWGADPAARPDFSYVLAELDTMTCASSRRARALQDTLSVTSSTLGASPAAAAAAAATAAAAAAAAVHGQAGLGGALSTPDGHSM